MTTICSFEVAAQPIAPVDGVPYYLQGTFVQITNIDQAQSDITVSYRPASPAFEPELEAVSLSANVIEANGTLAFEPSFLANGNSFFPRTITPGSTIIFGVQYIITPPATGSGPAPSLMPWMAQSYRNTPKKKTKSMDLSSSMQLAPPPMAALASRGLVDVKASQTTRLIVTATIRQLFLTIDANGMLIETDPGAYSLPIIGGSEVVAGP